MTLHNMACSNPYHSLADHDWPNNGDLTIVECQRVCGYCSQRVGTSNALRKHVAARHLGLDRDLHDRVVLLPGRVGQPPMQRPAASTPFRRAVANRDHHGLRTPALMAGSSMNARDTATVVTLQARDAGVSAHGDLGAGRGTSMLMRKDKNAADTKGKGKQAEAGAGHGCEHIIAKERTNNSAGIASNSRNRNSPSLFIWDDSDTPSDTGDIDFE